MSIVLRRAAIWGSVSAGSYTVLFLLILVAYVVGDGGDHQIAMAYLSLPTSIAVGSLAGPLLDALDDYRRLQELADWLCLFIAGAAQYFVVGFFLSFLRRPPAED